MVVRRRQLGCRVRGVCIGVAVVVVLGACTGDSDSAGAPTTASSRRTSTTPTTAVEVAVERAYRDFWDMFLAVGGAHPVDPEDPRIAEHATGEQLKTLSATFLATRAGNEVIRGSFELAPKVASVAGTTATVRDCYYDRSGVYDATAGARKDTESGLRHLVVATMVIEDGRWKMSRLVRRSEGCAPDEL